MNDYVLIFNIKISSYSNRQHQVSNHRTVLNILKNIIVNLLINTVKIESAVFAIFDIKIIEITC